MEEHRYAVIEWFNTISNKEQCKFVQMDIKDFYPSISQTTLGNVLQIADDNLRLIKHCRKSLITVKYRKKVI